MFSNFAILVLWLRFGRRWFGAISWVGGLGGSTWSLLRLWLFGFACFRLLFGGEWHLQLCLFLALIWWVLT